MRIKVTLVKSPVSCVEKQKATVKSLGLTKIGQSKIHEDNVATRGKIAKVAHLVKAEEVE